MEKGYEVRNGLVVPVEKKEPRKVAQVVAVRDEIVARADDGSLWVLNLTIVPFEWEPLPALPNG